MITPKNALVGSAIFGMLFLTGVAFSFSESHGISQALWGWISVPTLLDTVTFVVLLIMAIAGGAILPLVFGRIAKISGDMQSSYLYGIVCYLFIFMYAIKWHKMSSWS